MRASPLPLAFAFVVVSAASCLRKPEPAFHVEPARDAGVDAGAPLPQVLGLEAFDWDGSARPSDAVSRRPILVLRASGPIARPEACVMLVSGPVDEPLRKDFEALPLRGETGPRLVAAQVVADSDGSSIRITPAAPFERGAVIAVVVAGWAADVTGRRLSLEPTVFSLRVRDGPDAGARIVGTWPSDATSNVPPALSLAFVAFDGEVRHAEEIVLRAQDGSGIPTATRTAPCEELGAAGVCVVLAPRGPLREATVHGLWVPPEALDETGAPLGPREFLFSTGRPASVPPLELTAPDCAIDEIAMPAACAFVDDTIVELHARTSAPARFFLSLSGGANASAVGPRAEAWLRAYVGRPDADVSGTLEAFGFDGERVSAEVSVRTVGDLPTLTIDEVRGNPLGEEPRQEYVELRNFGTTSVDVFGLWLSDSPTATGDVLREHAVVGPEGRAMLVADRFDPEDDADDATPPGVALVHVGASLGSGGLGNEGEALYLRDALGRRVSMAPALSSPAGGCIVRVSAEPRDGRASAFERRPYCTPGTADTPRP